MPPTSNYVSVSRCMLDEERDTDPQSLDGKKMVRLREICLVFAMRGIRTR